MSAAADGGGRRGPGPADERRSPGRANADRGTTVDRRDRPLADDTTEAVDLGAASLPEPRRPRPGRLARRRRDEGDRRDERGMAAPAPAGAPPRAGRSVGEHRSPGRGRPPGRGRVIVVTALAGLVAAIAAGLLADAERSALVAGAGVGLVVGIVAGLAGSALAPRRAPVEVEGRPAMMAATGPGPSAPPSPGGYGRTAGAPDRGSTTEATESNLGPMLTAIGHRYRVLSDRQLAALGTFERRRSGDPDGSAGGSSGAADGLVQANRLARRMRRLAKTLQVLADDPASWEAAAPATMAEILEAAIADSGERDRIDGESLHAASVDGEAVPDVVHLLAELIDNAVAASSGSRSRVAVLGRRSADGYVLSVVDEGSGMAERQREEANTQLHTPPPLGQQESSSLGLATVSRLAARHGIAVTLLEAPTDGVIAKVRLPARLLGGAPPEVGPPAERMDSPAAAAGAGAGAVGAGAVGAGAVGAAATPRPGPPASVAGASPPLGSAAEARADLARRVQRSRPVPREVVALRRDQRPAELGRDADRAAEDTPPTDAPGDPDRFGGGPDRPDRDLPREPGDDG